MRGAPFQSTCEYVDAKLVPVRMTVPPAAAAVTWFGVTPVIVGNGNGVTGTVFVRIGRMVAAARVVRSGTGGDELNQTLALPPPAVTKPTPLFPLRLAMADGLTTLYVSGLLNVPSPLPSKTETL